MIKDKRYYRKKTLLLIFIYSLTIFTLGTCTYASLAWFSVNRNTEVNLSSITTAQGFSVTVKYLSYNAQIETGAKYYHGYKKSDIKSLDGDFSYQKDFLPIEDLSVSGPLGNQFFAPLYASTFCFEVTYDGGQMTFDATLTDFSSSASATQYSDSLSSYISLSEAIDVFTAYSDGTNLDSDAKAFLEATAGDSAQDRFNHSGSSLPDGEQDSWNPEAAMTIPSNGIGYFFITEYFTNDSSTLYSPVEGSEGHWIHDVNGNSNPYEGLSIVLSGVNIDRA